MDATHNDSLLHTFQSHTKHKKSGDLEIAREIHENLSESSDFTCFFLIFVCESHIERRKSQSSGLLQILDGIANISVFWRLNSSSKNFSRLVLVPELDLKNEFFKGTPLHLRLRILWDGVVVKLLRAESEYESVRNSTCSSSSLLRGSF